FLFGLFILPITSLWSQNSSQKPKLVVSIVVDQMRYDYINKFSEKFTKGGFNRIIANGFSCENNYLNYVPTNTGPGHATIYTGTTPSNHGILNNFWYDINLEKTVYCVSDSSVEPVGTGYKTGRSSPKRLLVNTIGDVNRQETAMKGKTISISIKDRAAVLSGGHTANAAYWFVGKTQGHWISSSYYMEKLPRWVHSFNDSNRLGKYMKEWKPLFPIESYTQSGPDNRPFERGFRGKKTPTFPYNLASLSIYNGGFDILKSTPFGNSYTLDFALAALKAVNLGRDVYTDFLLISLSSSDYIGHNFGVNSKEVQDTYLRLDRDLEKFINALDAQLGHGKYTLVLTSDHGATENPNYLIENGHSGGYFKEATFKIELKDHVFKQYGTTNIIKNISGNQVYLNKSLIVSMGLKISDMEDMIQRFILDQPQIETAITRTQFLNQKFTSGLELFMQNGFHLDRSGDIVYSLKPSVIVYAETGSDHGSGYFYDIHVPLLFYGFGIAKGSTTKLTSSIDIVPTLAALLGLPLSNETMGTSISEVLK
ncbi:MAG: alkaline phosphatase family protein, partial [Flavobacteriaceae bacterium]|nr:alkaline phosphatase family protein [Flavobacteriaceae bacterium]